MLSCRCAKSFANISFLGKVARYESLSPTSAKIIGGGRLLLDPQTEEHNRGQGLFGYSHCSCTS